jgi:hypothetical protein
MAEPRTVVSPKENIAAAEVLTVTDAQNRIKALIVKSYYKNWTKDQLEKEIANVIRQTTSSVAEKMKPTIAQALAQNAQKWHYLYMTNQKVINLETIKQAIRVDNKTYSIDMVSLASGQASESRAVVERFRPLLTQDKLGSQLIADYDKRVKGEIQRLASNPANLSRIDKNGKAYTINMRNFAEMQVRYEANLADVKKLKDENVKLVWTSSHADASGRCAPYQGRLYSLDGTSGSVNGKPYEPLDEALLGPKGDGNGIINGYNCRHRLIEYQPGSGSPKEYDQKTIQRENAINNRQRQYEREIRNRKTEAELYRQSGDIESAKRLERSAQLLTENYKSFSFKNQRPYYEWRTRVTNEEVAQY